MTIPFSEQLRVATADAHQQAERSAFVTDLVEGRLTIGEFAALVAQLHAVYSQLEEAVEASQHPDLDPFLRRELDRAPSLATDLADLVPDHDARPAVLPATDAYCARLRDVCFTWPGGLLAHHYVRYLGDLSGGQVLGRIVQRVYDLPDGKGITAYRFDGIESPKRFKDDYRTALDRVPFDDDERARIVAEANVAFALNTAVFAELAQARERLPA